MIKNLFTKLADYWRIIHPSRAGANYPAWLQSCLWSAFLFLICIIAAIGANFPTGFLSPNFFTTNAAPVILGTNQMMVVTNPATGMILIGPTTPISQTASNAAQSVANNTSNVLQSALTATVAANDNTTSNALTTALTAVIVANDAATSNALKTTIAANDNTTSNALTTALTAVLVANDNTTSNALTTAFVANDATGSNALRTASANNDITTSNGVVSLVSSNFNFYNVTNLVTASNTVGATVDGLFGQSANLVEWKTNHIILAAVKSNGCFVLPNGTAAFPSVGFLTDDDGTGAGIYRRAANSVGLSCNGAGIFYADAGGFGSGQSVFYVNSSDMLMWNGGAIGWEGSGSANSSSTVDTRFMRDAPNVIAQRINPTKAGTNRLYGHFSTTNTHFLEFCYDQVFSAYYLRANTNQTGTSAATNMPLVLSANGTNQHLKLNTNGVVAVSPNGGGGLAVGPSGTSITNILTGSATLDFPSTSVGAVADLAITVTGAADGDVVQVAAPQGSMTAIIGSFSGFASNNTVFVRFIPTASSQDPASGTFKVIVTKF